METSPYEVNTVEAKNRFNELVTETRKTKKPIVVQKRGEPVAVILDYESYQQNMASKPGKGSKTLLADLINFHRTMKKKYPKGTGDSAEILRQIRRERSER